MELERYLQHIGYTGSREPVLATLAGIQLQHTLTLPFENLDPLMGQAVRLDAPALADKLLGQGRGGLCYEHNVLLQGMLTALGFKVTGLAARVLWNAPEGTVRARTHMLLKVDLPAGGYLVDVGFGGMTPSGPLRLVPEEPQRTPHEDFRVMPEERPSGERWRVEGWTGSWRALYHFDLQPQLPPDYEAASWYVCTHPASAFVQVLMAARLTLQERYTLAGNQLRRHAAGASDPPRLLSSTTQLREVLTDIFGIRLPQHPQLEAALGRQLTLIAG